jgi:hypothetical protein
MASNEDQNKGSSILMALLNRGLLNIGPVDRGVMFPMARLVWWDLRREEIEVVLQAGDSTETITIDGEAAKGFRHDLRMLTAMTAETVEQQQMQEFLRQVPEDGSKH